jgi:hypothetical protein
VDVQYLRNNFSDTAEHTPVHSSHIPHIIAIMVVSTIPPIQFTPIEDIQGRVSTLRKTFLEHKTRDLEFRLVQLRKLYWA